MHAEPFQTSQSEPVCAGFGLVWIRTMDTRASSHGWSNTGILCSTHTMPALCMSSRPGSACGAGSVQGWSWHALYEVPAPDGPCVLAPVHGSSLWAWSGSQTSLMPLIWTIGLDVFDPVVIKTPQKTGFFRKCSAQINEYQVDYNGLWSNCLC